MKKVREGWIKSDNYIKKFFQLIDSKITLFKDHLRQTTKKDLDEWKKNDERNVLSYYSGLALDNILTYGFAGFCLAYIAFSLDITPTISLRTVISYSLLYWFLIRLLEKIFGKK